MDTISVFEAHNLEAWARHWLQAAHRQAARCISQEDPEQRLADLFLFSVVLHSFKTSCAKLLGRGSEPYQRFEKNHPDLTTVRDILSHFDEYVLGKGRLQPAQEGPKRHSILWPAEILDDATGPSLFLGWQTADGLRTAEIDVLAAMADAEALWDAAQDSVRRREAQDREEGGWL